MDHPPSFEEQNTKRTHDPLDDSHGGLRRINARSLLIKVMIECQEADRLPLDRHH